jgi:predicted SprT family Zn-dependent metalloprotease
MGVAYRSLVSPSHANCAVIQKAVNDCLANARRIFGEAATESVSRIACEYFARGRNVAVATWGECPKTNKPVGVIQFSLQHVTRKLVVMVKQIIPHEVAHVICMVNGLDDGHGKVWRQVCMMLGGNGETFSTLSSMDGRVKYAYEALLPSGDSVWLTPQQKRELATSDLMVQTYAGEVITLTKHSLTGKMRPV